MNLRKLFIIFGSLSLSQFVYANNISPQEMHAQEPLGDITPKFGPKVMNGPAFFLTADFIYWKTVQEGSVYSINSKSAGSATDRFANTPQKQVRSVGFDWSPGFKVGAGLAFSHGDWDLFAQYTWLRPDNTDRTTTEIWTFPTPNTSVLVPMQVEGKWKLDFNVIDLELGRHFYLNRFLTLRPFIGLKGTWQDYRLTTKSSAETGFSLDPPPSGGVPIQATGPETTTRSSDICGIGIRGGLNLAWYFTKNWSVFGHLTWNILLTKYSDLKLSTVVFNAPTNTLTKTENIKKVNNNYTNKYVGEGALGIQWEMWFSNNKYHLAIQTGWEQQVWINYILDARGSERYDLSFHGLSFKARFDF